MDALTSDSFIFERSHPMVEGDSRPRAFSQAAGPPHSSPTASIELSRCQSRP